VRGGFESEQKKRGILKYLSAEISFEKSEIIRVKRRMNAEC